MREFHLNDVTYRLLRKCDFSFLARLGRAFCVFDENDSGNISFGLENEQGERFFVKIAGALTANGIITPAHAADNLRKALPLYEAMRHPRLIELLEHFSHKKLEVAVFRWAEGECLFDHWNFDRYQQTGEPRPYERFRALPLPERLRAFEAVLSFFEAVEAASYVAIDFYAGSILYDFSGKETMVCDIDLFYQQPCRNDMGRMWGQRWFMSLEEWQAGAVLDDRTNVYRLGAAAWMFFGAGYPNHPVDRGAAKWDAEEALWRVAVRATEPKPAARYTSVSEFSAAWSAATNQKK
ncbi:MAG: hypothetical protein LBJ11_09725 [Oscillospiraceae bacterium]|jgi:serine/threonine-protein kinase|nr:hypothetical protein [Oscillospiraceae bacterium]